MSLQRIFVFTDRVKSSPQLPLIRYSVTHPRGPRLDPLPNTTTTSLTAKIQLDTPRKKLSLSSSRSVFVFFSTRLIVRGGARNVLLLAQHASCLLAEPS